METFTSEFLVHVDYNTEKIRFWSRRPSHTIRHATDDKGPETIDSISNGHSDHWSRLLGLKIALATMGYAVQRTLRYHWYRRSWKRIAPCVRHVILQETEHHASGQQDRSYGDHLKKQRGSNM